MFLSVKPSQIQILEEYTSVVSSTILSFAVLDFQHLPRSSGSPMVDRSICNRYYSIDKEDAIWNALSSQGDASQPPGKSLEYRGCASGSLYSEEVPRRLG